MVRKGQLGRLSPLGKTPVSKMESATIDRVRRQAKKGLKKK